jgi:hypothetical protein
VPKAKTVQGARLTVQDVGANIGKNDHRRRNRGAGEGVKNLNINRIDGNILR